MTIAFTLLSRERIVSLLEQELILGILAITLLIVTVVRFFLYLAAVRNEIDLLDLSFDSEKIVVIRGPVFAIIICLSVAFAVKIATVTNILIYLSTAVIFTVLDMFGSIVLSRNIGMVLIEKPFRGEEINEHAYILYKFFFSRPTVVRVAFMLVAMILSLMLALVGSIKESQPLIYVSYIIAISTIIVGEIVMLHWRNVRDKDIEALNMNKT